MGAVKRGIALLCLLLLNVPVLAQEPEVLLLQRWKGQDISGWLMSEKLDGIRALWDGRTLRTRQGKEIVAPAWFVHDFPPFAIDGELWSGRGEFQLIASIVRDSVPGQDWQRITYNIFEVPGAEGGLLKRLDRLKRWLRTHPDTTLRLIEQIPCRDNAHLQTFHDKVVAQGGEGVVVRNPDAPWEPKRTPNALKVKRFEDDECVVTGYTEGKGRLAGEVGALKCRLPNGKRFKIGSGLNDALRRTPPSLGSTVTFKHQGWTEGGKPRFPVFMRVRFPAKEPLLRIDTQK